MADEAGIGLERSGGAGGPTTTQAALDFAKPTGGQGGVVSRALGGGQQESLQDLNLLQKTGIVLGDVARGAQGQPPQPTQLLEGIRQRRAQEVQQATAMLNLSQAVHGGTQARDRPAGHDRGAGDHLPRVL